MKEKYIASDRKSSSFRVWDWLAIFLAMLLFFGAAGYYFYTKYLPERQEEIACILLVKGVERTAWEAEEMISVGDTLRCRNGTIEMGRIEEVVVKPHLYAVVGEEGASWEMHPYLIDIEVLVTMHVREKTGDGLRVGDLRIAAGSTGEYRFGRYLSRAELVEVRRTV